MEEQKSIALLENRVLKNPPEATPKDLVPLAKYYYDLYLKEEREREKSLLIGKATYYGSWAVKRNYRNKSDLQEFIKYHKLDIATGNPADTTEEDLNFLQEVLEKTEELEKN